MPTCNRYVSTLSISPPPFYGFSPPLNNLTPQSLTPLPKFPLKFATPETLWTLEPPPPCPQLRAILLGSSFPR